jgi:hypothetical protein
MALPIETLTMEEKQLERAKRAREWEAWPKGEEYQRLQHRAAGHTEDAAKTYIHFRFTQVLQAPIEGPRSTLLVAEGVTGIYWTKLHDRPMTYTSGFFRFYRSLQV